MCWEQSLVLLAKHIIRVVRSLDHKMRTKRVYFAISFACLAPESYNGGSKKQLLTVLYHFDLTNHWCWWLKNVTIVAATATNELFSTVRKWRWSILWWLQILPILLSAIWTLVLFTTWKGTEGRLLDGGLRIVVVIIVISVQTIESSFPLLPSFLLSIWTTRKRTARSKRATTIMQRTIEWIPKLSMFLWITGSLWTNIGWILPLAWNCCSSSVSPHQRRFLLKIFTS